MLNSLEIRHFRKIKQLEIQNLSRINLITGKNNTGKSTMLEAISVYAFKGHIHNLLALLRDRGELYGGMSVLDEHEKKRKNARNHTFAKNLHRTLVSIFCKDGEDPTKKEIVIGELNSPEKRLTFKLVRFIYQFRDFNGPQGNFKSSIPVIVPDTYANNDYLLGASFTFNKIPKILELNENVYNLPYENYLTGYEETSKFIHVRDISDDENNAIFWDNIVLTDKEDFVIAALKIIEPNIQRLNFVLEEPDSENRIPVVRLQDGTIQSLRSMGDGINRILTIILALVNCDQGYLMVDEIETGLHYTVLFVLWKVIYELATKLNVQVFATTHSTDCIRCYGDFLKEIEVEGNLIRLDNIGDGIKATLYPVPEILIAKEHQIEVR